MDGEQVPTLAPDAPPVDVPPVPVPPQGSIPTPQVESEGQVEPPQGEDEGAEKPPEQPAWAGLPPNEVLEHEDFVPLIEEQLEAARKETESKTHKKLQPLLQGWNENSAASRQAMSGMWNDLQGLVAKGDLEPNALAGLLKQNDVALRAFTQNEWWQGLRYGMEMLGKVTDDDLFANDAVARINRMAQNGTPDPDLGNDLHGRLIQTAITTASDKATKPLKAEILSLKAENQALRAKARPEGPDDAPKGGGGGKKYLDMTREERDALSNEERDRLTATQ